jgi:hypothetical protein
MPLLPENYLGIKAPFKPLKRRFDDRVVKGHSQNKEPFVNHSIKRHEIIS